MDFGDTESVRRRCVYISIETRLKTRSVTKAGTAHPTVTSRPSNASFENFFSDCQPASQTLGKAAKFRSTDRSMAGLVAGRAWEPGESIPAYRVLVT